VADSVRIHPGWLRLGLGHARRPTGLHLHTARGNLASRPAEPDHTHPAFTHGFPRADSHRTLCYADGAPLFLVVDTAWALPWRATLDDVAVYAADRQAKGFNAVLMMSVQPDMNTRGPGAATSTKVSRSASATYPTAT
jgi:Protein of unknown function (DUF4038)